jgi:glycerol-3-phosphate O-acyltransferase
MVGQVGPATAIGRLRLPAAHLVLPDCRAGRPRAKVAAGTRLHSGHAPGAAASMGSSVTLPLWLVLLAGVLAAWAVLDRLLVPSVRWFLRSRANKVLDEVGHRLKIKVRPFQQSGRRNLIDRLVYDDQVQEAVRAHAQANGVPREVAAARAAAHAREIVPAFNAYLYFRLGYWLGKTISRSLYRVRIGYTDDAGLDAVPEQSTVVFVMNHRSNMDYIIASYLAAEKAALSYAVGEWARIWGLQQLIRAMGAYFVRRDSRDELYRRVLARYITLATEAGVTQAVYPEGGLSRDGRMRPPKFGVFDYMLRGFRVDGERDLVFVPLGLNYDRTLEDRTLLLAAQADRVRPGRLQAAGTTLRFAVRQLSLRLRSRWYRFGYACVNFGTPVSMRQWCAEHGLDFRTLAPDQRAAAIARLGQSLMDRVGALIPVLPVPLVATVLLEAAPAALSELELKTRIGALAQRLQQAGAHTYVPRGDWDYAIGAGLRMLVLRRLVRSSDGLHVADPAQLPVLRYYANSIAHLLPETA